MDALLFSQFFPFSEKAKQVLKESNVSIDSVPDSVVRKAALIVSRAYAGKEYASEVGDPSAKEMEQEVMAFTVAKIFVSASHAAGIIEKFAALAQKNTFNYLVNFTDSKDLAFELAKDFGIAFDISDEKGIAAEVPISEYVKIYFNDKETKLVNEPVEGGKVFLNPNDFARFLAEKAYAKIFDSLPIPKDNIPLKYQTLAKSIDSQLVTIEKKEFDIKIEGKMDPNLFPPCMSHLYADQLAGKKLSYYARLSLASFLQKLGMTKSEMLTMFSKSPDFKPYMAEYHINRIFDKQLSAPACRKMAEYGLNVPECKKGCTSKHPVSYYIGQLRVKNRMKNASNGK